MNLIHPITYKQREIKELEIVFHDIPDEHGEMQKVKCVEFIVIGNNTEWKDYLYFDDFKKANPELEKELSKDE